MVQKKNKKTNLEILRILAIVLVVYNHTDMAAFSWSWEHRGEHLYFLSLILAVLCKMAVPIFFMISGALLADKEENIVYIYRKRVSRYVFVLILFSLIYYLWSQFFYNSNDFSIPYFIKTLVTSGFGKYWFLYAYISMLIMLPFLRKLALSLTNQNFIYLIILNIFFAGIKPIVQLLLFGNSVALNYNFRSFFADTINWNVMYFLLGYFIEKRISVECLKKHYRVAMIGGGGTVLVSCWMIDFQSTYVDYFDETFHCALIVVPTLAVVITVKLFGSNLTKKAEQIVYKLGSLTFGMYLFEGMVRPMTKDVYNVCVLHMHSLLASMIWVVVVLFVSGILTWLFQKIPIVGKLI